MKKILLFSAFFILTAACLTFAQGKTQPCIVIYGDSRTNHEVHQKITDAIMKVKPPVVFHLGDMVEKGSRAEDWDIFGRITEPLRRVAEFYPVRGNHEQNIRIPFLDPRVFEDKDWYSLERCGLHCIVLDSTLDLSAGSQQYQWLEAELKRMRGDKKPIIVFLHHPLFSISKRSEESVKLRDALCPLFEKYRVAAVFSGHEHNYQRFLYRRIYYIDTGGGGAPLHYRSAWSRFNQKFIEAYNFCALSVAGNRLEVQVYDIDSKPIDRFEIKIPR